MHLTNEDLLPLARALKNYGISYWTSRWKQSICDTVFYDGIVYMEKNVRFGITWNAYDIDPKYVKPFADENDGVIGDVLGVHWPNFLRFNAQKNLERIPDWVDYFNRQKEFFGVMLAKDIAFSTSQHLYRRFAKTKDENGVICIALSDVFEKGSGFISGEFYISIQKGVDIEKVVGGEISLYEEHKEFITYKIKHSSSKIEIYTK